VRDQILEGDSILTLTATVLRVMRVSTRVDVFSAPSIEQSAMISRHGRGCDHGRDFEGWGRGFVGGGRGSYGGRQSASKKGPDNADTVDKVITSPRSAGRNLVELSRHNFLSLIFLLRVALLRIIHQLPPLFLDLLRLYGHRRSMIDFDSYSSLKTIFQQLMHASGMHAYTASPQKP